MRFFTLTLQFILLLLGVVSSLAVPPVVKTASLETYGNFIAKDYPNDVTGTANGTIMVLPIPYKLARELIPAQYAILTDAYFPMLPAPVPEGQGFVQIPRDSYPVIIKFAVEHDIRVEAAGLSIPDFQSVQIMFPFVDLLGDGHTSFTWKKNTLISCGHKTALDGAAAYGINPIPATFEPLLEAYQHSHFWFMESTITQKVTAEAPGNTLPNSLTLAYEGEFLPLPVVARWSIDFYRNVTNQPFFGDGKTCGQQITFFNNSLSLGHNPPGGVVGEAFLSPPYFHPTEYMSADLQMPYGIKVANSYIQKNYLPCESFKGV